MRFNFLILVGLMAALALMSLLQGEYFMAGLMAAVSVFLLLVHRKRVKAFKAYDQSRSFD